MKRKIIVFFCLIFLPSCLCAESRAAERAAQSTGKGGAEDNHTFIYAADFAFAPYRTRVGNDYGGFEIDITRAIFKDSKYALQYRERTWNINQIPSQLRNKDWDIIGWRIIDPIVSAEYFYSEPAFEFHWGAFTRPGVGKLDITDLKQYKTGVVTHKYPYALLRKRGYVENRDFKVFATHEAAMKALLAGEIDIWFDERLAASTALIKANLLSGVVYHEELERVTPVGYAIRPVPEHAELKRFIDKRIKEIKADGQYEYIYTLYFGANSDEYRRAQQRHTLLVISGMVLVLVLLAGISAVLVHLLRKQARLGAALRRTVDELETSKEQYQMAVEGANDGIIYYDSDVGAPFLSPRFFEILDIDSSAARDLNTLLPALITVAADEDRDKLLRLQESINRRQAVAFSAELRIRRKEGARWIFLRVRSRTDTGRYILGGAVSDITMRKEQEAVIIFYAECDPLTGIYNRRKMDSLGAEMVEACRAQQTSLSLAYIDLDNFKRVNDTLGHQQGDLVLTGFVNEVKRLLPKDAVFGRVGGDEFIILLPYKYRATAIMQGILAGMSGFTACPVPVSASIGIAFYPEHGLELEDLIKNADDAARLAKAGGKNRIVVFGEEASATK